MILDEATTRPPDPAITPGRRARAELAMAVGGFGIGTGEFVIMGLLPAIAGDAGVSVTEGAGAIGAYALGVVVGAPVIAVVAARWPRHVVLAVLMAWFAAGNVASALATGLPALVAARFLAGLPHGAYFGVASLVAASLVPADRRARAVGRMMLGLTGATVAGVPLATWLGQGWGWRAAFAFVGLIGLLACGLIAAFVPRRPADRAASPLRELGALRRAQVLLTLGIGSVGLGGLFCVFSYITPTMTLAAGLPERWMPWVLAVFGVGMVSGNLLGARLADRALMPTIGGALVWNILVMGLFSISISITAAHAGPALATILLISHGVALVPALQIRLMDVAEDAQTLAASLNHSAFNIANALGAWLGGVAIDSGLGWSSTGWVGSLLAAAGLSLFVISAALARAKTGGIARVDRPGGVWGVGWARMHPAIR